MHKVLIVFACLFVGLPALQLRAWDEAPRVLLFWTVNSAQNTKDLVKAGVKAFKESGVRFHLLLAHYDEDKQSWAEGEDKDWYKEHVKFSSNKKGFKLHLLKSEIAEHKIDVAKDYDYVWAPDNDIDMGSTDIAKLFKEVAKTDAVLMAPSLLQFGAQGQWQQPSHWPAAIPQSRCSYHHVPSIEVMAPVFRSKALEKFLECEDCLGPVGDWGADMLWCSYLGRMTGRDKKTACAVIDQVSVIHKNYGRMTYDKKYTDVFLQDSAIAKSHHHEDDNESDAFKMAAYDCIGPDGTDQGVDELDFNDDVLKFFDLRKKPEHMN